MIKIKTDKEVELLRKAGEITRNTLLEVEKHIKPGVTTKQLDKIAYEFILKNHATPSLSPLNHMLADYKPIISHYDHKSIHEEHK